MSTPAGRERTDRLRALPLTDILRAIAATPARHDPAKWHTERGVLSIHGAKFFNWSQATGGGGAIDLAMHLNRMNFKDAVDWLASRFTSWPPAAPIMASPPAPRLALPAAVADALPAVIGYLSAQRRLPLAWLQPLVASGDLYADGHRNAVFLLRNEHNAPVGAELRGTGQQTWRGMAPGSRKHDGYFAVGSPCPQAIILCESAIDAISCRTLYPDRLCISTSGARDNTAWLPALLARALPTYCGFDDDPTGERMAQAMLARYPPVQRLRPPTHDWNDTLRAQA
jgi:hypothetical protein